VTVPSRDEGGIARSAECQKLRDIAIEIRRNHARRDAYAAFLDTHYCICNKTSQPGTPSGIAALNTVFAKRCAEVHEQYKAEAFEKMSPFWIRAFYRYERKPNSPETVLPWMALAHIVDDLEVAISRVGIRNFSKADYDAVLNDILSCLEEVRASIGIAQTLSGKVYTLMRDVFAVGERLTIRKLRDVAYETARERAELMSARRRERT
jgi:hypothetical protein